MKGGTKAGRSRHLLHEADQRRQDVGCGSVQATSHPMKKSSSTIALLACGQFAISLKEIVKSKTDFERYIEVCCQSRNG
jgi:hypothetical protein